MWQYITDVPAKRSSSYKISQVSNFPILSNGLSLNAITNALTRALQRVNKRKNIQNWQLKFLQYNLCKQYVPQFLIVSTIFPHPVFVESEIELVHGGREVCIHSNSPRKKGEGYMRINYSINYLRIFFAVLSKGCSQPRPQCPLLYCKAGRPTYGNFNVETSEEISKRGCCVWPS
jgi:hypothetical protein